MRNSVKILLLTCTSLMSIDSSAARLTAERDAALKQAAGFQQTINGVDAEIARAWDPAFGGHNPLPGAKHNDTVRATHDVVNALDVALAAPGGGGAVAAVADVAATIATLTPAVTAITGAAPVAGSTANANAQIVANDHAAARAPLDAIIAGPGGPGSVAPAALAAARVLWGAGAPAGRLAPTDGTLGAQARAIAAYLGDVDDALRAVIPAPAGGMMGGAGVVPKGDPLVRVPAALAAAAAAMTAERDARQAVLDASDAALTLAGFPAPAAPAAPAFVGVDAAARIGALAADRDNKLADIDAAAQRAIAAPGGGPVVGNAANAQANVGRVIAALVASNTTLGNVDAALVAALNPGGVGALGDPLARVGELAARAALAGGGGGGGVFTHTQADIDAAVARTEATFKARIRGIVNVRPGGNTINARALQSVFDMTAPAP